MQNTKRPRWAPLFGLEKIYCSVPPQKSFLPSVMFPNSTAFFHTTLNSPTLLSAPRSTSRERCRSTSMKNFTRKSSKLTRSGCKNTPLSLPKRDGQNSRCALPRRFVPPPSSQPKLPKIVSISRVGVVGFNWTIKTNLREFHSKIIEFQKFKSNIFKITAV